MAVFFLFGNYIIKGKRYSHLNNKGTVLFAAPLFIKLFISYKNQCVSRNIARNSAAIIQVVSLISLALPVNTLIIMLEIIPNAIP